MSDIRVAIVGLDTSHSVEFPQRMQAPDCPPGQRVAGMRAVSCLRFETPFQGKEGLDRRQAQLEAWGVRVTADFDTAVSECDALMIEINDPAYHLDYFLRCAALGKPIFLDKPLADTLANGRRIAQAAAQHATKVFSSSSLRFAPALAEALAAVPQPGFATVYGAMGLAPAGSSVIWYGVHAFEMLQRAMGRGAATVDARKDAMGVVAIVAYPDGRRGVVELTENHWNYGGCLHSKAGVAPFRVDASRLYSDELVEVAKFFRGGPAPVAIEDTLEVLALLEATDRSLRSGAAERAGAA
jgi:predicted dehydrogenase